MPFVLRQLFQRASAGDPAGFSSADSCGSDDESESEGEAQEEPSQRSSVAADVSVDVVDDLGADYQATEGRSCTAVLVPKHQPKLQAGPSLCLSLRIDDLDDDELENADNKKHEPERQLALDTAAVEWRAVGQQALPILRLSHSAPAAMNKHQLWDSTFSVSVNASADLLGSADSSSLLEEAEVRARLSAHKHPSSSQSGKVFRLKSLQEEYPAANQTAIMPSFTPAYEETEPMHSTINDTLHGGRRTSVRSPFTKQKRHAMQLQRPFKVHASTDSGSEPLSVKRLDNVETDSGWSEECARAAALPRLMPLRRLSQATSTSFSAASTTSPQSCTAHIPAIVDVIRQHTEQGLPNYRTVSGSTDTVPVSSASSTFSPSRRDVEQSRVPSEPSNLHRLRQPHAILIDGSAVFFRALMAQRQNADAALPIFTRLMMKVLEQVRPFEYAAVFFDYRTQVSADAQHPRLPSEINNPRRTLDPSYKANRRSRTDRIVTPGDKLPRLSASDVKATCDALGIFCCMSPMFDLDGRFEMWEADDICASVAKTLSESGFHVTICAVDKDFVQCVNPNVCACQPFREFAHHGSGSVRLFRMFGPTVASLREGENGAAKDPFIDCDAATLAFASLGVRAVEAPAFQALAGDATDGIKGLPSITAESARRLCHEFSVGALDTSRNTVATQVNALENIKAAARMHGVASLDKQMFNALRAVRENEQLLNKNFQLVRLNTALQLRNAVECAANKMPVEQDEVSFLRTQLIYRGLALLRLRAGETVRPDDQCARFVSFVRSYGMIVSFGELLQRITSSAHIPVIKQPVCNALVFHERLTHLWGLGRTKAACLWQRGVRSVEELQSRYRHEQAKSELFLLTEFEQDSVRFASELLAPIERHVVEIHQSYVQRVCLDVNEKSSRVNRSRSIDIRVRAVGEFRRQRAFSSRIVFLLVCSPRSARRPSSDGELLNAQNCALQLIIDELVARNYIISSAPRGPAPTSTCCVPGGCANTGRSHLELCNHVDRTAWHGICRLPKSNIVRALGSVVSPVKRARVERHAFSPRSLTPDSTNASALDRSSSDSAVGETTSTMRYVSLIAVSEDELPAAELCYTGPLCYVQRVRANVRRRGFDLCPHGLFVEGEGGVKFRFKSEARTERDMLCEVGEEGRSYIAPQDRRCTLTDADGE